MVDTSGTSDALAETPAGDLRLFLVRIEGKLDRMNDRVERYERDHQGLRERVHGLANEITPIVMLNLPERIRAADTSRASIEARIQALEGVELQRKGAANLAKLIWGIAGAVGVSGVAAIVRLFMIGGL